MRNAQTHPLPGDFIFLRALQLVGGAVRRSRTWGGSQLRSLEYVGDSSGAPSNLLRRSTPTHPSCRWLRTFWENKVRSRLDGVRYT